MTKHIKTERDELLEGIEITSAEAKQTYLYGISQAGLKLETPEFFLQVRDERLQVAGLAWDYWLATVRQEAVHDAVAEARKKLNSFKWHPDMEEGFIDAIRIIEDHGDEEREAFHNE